VQFAFVLEGLVEWLSACFFAIAAEVHAEDNAAPVKRVKVEGGWSDAPGSMPAFGKTLNGNHCISSLLIFLLTNWSMV